jgi:hypothetical protein
LDFEVKISKNSSRAEKTVFEDKAQRVYLFEAQIPGGLRRKNQFDSNFAFEKNHFDFMRIP